MATHEQLKAEAERGNRLAETVREMRRLLDLSKTYIPADLEWLHK
jgi:hypothetical protein